MLAVMSTMRALIRELGTSGIVRPQKGASMREIGDVQALLGVGLPRVYVEFARACGVLKVYDRSVFGLGPATQKMYGMTESTLFHTLYYRRNYGLPTPFVVVWHDSHEDCQCLDLRRVKNGECPVVRQDPTKKSAKRITEVATSFEAWLRMIVEKQVAMKELLDAEMPGKLKAMGEIRVRPRRKVGKKAGRRAKGK